MRRIALLFALLLLLSACAPGWGEPSGAREGGGYSFWLTSGDMTFNAPGERARITYHLNPRDITLSFSSSDENVATVDRYYVVTAVGPGTCEIFYRVGDDYQMGIMQGSFQVVVNGESLP